VSLPSPPLLVITDRHQARAPLERVLAAVFTAGCRWASVREKDLSAEEQVVLVRRLLPVARRHGARLTLHGDAGNARAAGPDGVHLPSGADAKSARALLGKAALIGISVHAPEEAAMLDPGTVEYAIAGPAYATASKPGYRPLLGLAGIAAIAAVSRIPVVVIGGIGPGVVGEMLAAGAAGIAVMSSVMRAADPDAEVRALIAALDRRVQPRPR
jgi:thiamine-phosphate pyrophosphorylase